MRPGVEITVTAEDRARLAAITADRNAPQKHAWRAQIILLSADRLGTMAVVRRTGKPKPFVWSADPDDIISAITQPWRMREKEPLEPVLYAARFMEEMQEGRKGTGLEDSQMTIWSHLRDIGPKPQSFDLEQATRDNENYRTVVWSGRYLQLALMSIPVGGDIGLEMHPETDQFLRLDAGRGRAQLGPSKDQLTFDQEVSDGWCVLIPAGTWHNVTNIGDEPMQVYVIYAPAHHKPGKIHETASDAAADADDEPAEWSVQPNVAGADQHA